MELDINELKNELRNAEMKKIHYRMKMEKFDVNDNSELHDEAIEEFSKQDLLVELLNMKIKDYEYFEQKNGKVGVRDVLKFQSYKNDQLLDIPDVEEKSGNYREQALTLAEKNKQKQLVKIITDQLCEIRKKRLIEKKVIVIAAASTITMMVLEKIFM
ncbi:hypothetical protein A0H77_19430 [Vibrio alginolyticus]|uniref:hypothetical protein n=1 Tax=Vibrio alginolyticus TaxID=663 RepID=UPI0007950858|nr:hypothetical protein [Vibrio alginolyticus]KXZ35070.1 hypothetical protein A0H77_19430 [Vibrio alginolyticus]